MNTTRKVSCHTLSFHSVSWTESTHPSLLRCPHMKHLKTKRWIYPWTIQCTYSHSTQSSPLQENRRSSWEREMPTLQCLQLHSAERYPGPQYVSPASSLTPSLCWPLTLKHEGKYTSTSWVGSLDTALEGQNRIQWFGKYWKLVLLFFFIITINKQTLDLHKLSPIPWKMLFGSSVLEEPNFLLFFFLN